MKKYIRVVVAVELVTVGTKIESIFVSSGGLLLRIKVQILWLSICLY